MNHSPETLLMMARDAYQTGIAHLRAGEFDALQEVMAVRDDVLAQLADRFDDRMVQESCNPLLSEVHEIESDFMKLLQKTLEEFRGGLENRRRNQGKLKKYAG